MPFLSTKWVTIKTRKKLLHQRRFTISYQPMLKISQTTWTQSTQLSHNQLVLELGELHSMPKLKNKMSSKRNTDITIKSIIKLKILVIMVLMKQSTDSHLPIRASFHNLGEEHRLLTQLMDSRTHPGSGSIKSH